MSHLKKKDWSQDSYPSFSFQISCRYHKHRKEWNEKQAAIQEKRQATIPETKYQHDYKYKDIRPRSTKKPPPSPRDPYPPAMHFDTNQRLDFTPKDVSVRASLIQPVSVFSRL